MTLSRTEKFVIGLIVGIVLGTIAANVWFLTHPVLVYRPTVKACAAGMLL